MTPSLSSRFWLHFWFIGLLCLSMWSVGCGCETTTPPADGGSPKVPATSGRAVVVGMRGESGVLGVIDTSTHKVHPRVVPVSNDAVLRYQTIKGEGYLFVINRLTHDNIQVFRTSDFSLVKQYSVGAGTNPQDIVVVSPSLAYVSLLRKSWILKVNPLTGKELGRIDVSGFAEVGEKPCAKDGDCKSKKCLKSLCARDGLPETSRMHLHGNRLWVVLQQLDRTATFAPRNKGKLLLFKADTGKLEKSLTLLGTNPTQTLLSPDKKQLWIVQTGKWFEKDDKPVLDGLVEAFDLETATSRGVVLREREVHSNLSTLVATSKGQYFAILSGKKRQTRLVELDWKNKSVLRTLASSECVDKGVCYSFFDAKWHPSGTLYLADRHLQKPGVRLFSTKTGKELTSAPLDVGLPPMSVVFLPSSQKVPQETSTEPTTEPAEPVGDTSDSGEPYDASELVDGGEPAGDGDAGASEPWKEGQIQPWPDWNPDVSLTDRRWKKPGAGHLQKVISFQPGPHATHGHKDFPGVIQGVPRGKGHFAGSFHTLSLGCGGQITLEFSSPVIVDGPGVDFIVFENAFTQGNPGDETFSEPAEVSVSPNGKKWFTFPCKLKGATWPYPQCAGTAPTLSHPDNGLDPFDVSKAGGNGFDLKDLGLKAVRFVRIKDRSRELPTSALECSQPQAGFDLDAISVVWGHHFQ